MQLAGVTTDKPPANAPNASHKALAPALPLARARQCVRLKGSSGELSVGCETVSPSKWKSSRTGKLKTPRQPLLIDLRHQKLHQMCFYEYDHWL
jgi:hypothetical protein